MSQMNLREDGTITFSMPGIGDKPDLDVTLRRPRLEELFDLWEMIDKISASTAEAAEAATTRVSIVETMKTNLRWTRSAVAALGNPSVYEATPARKNSPADFKLTNEDVDEPAWFVNGTVAAQWLRHWQEVPLAPGAPKLTAV